MTMVLGYLFAGLFVVVVLAFIEAVGVSASPSSRMEDRRYAGIIVLVVVAWPLMLVVGLVAALLPSRS